MPLKANKQAIDDALNTVRRFAKGGKVPKYADAGFVPNPEFDPNQRRVYINEGVPPPTPVPDAAEGYQPEQPRTPAEPPLPGAEYGVQDFDPREFKEPGIMDYIRPGEDFRKYLHEYANEGPAALHEQGQENMRSGHPGKMLLGAGQEVLGAALPAIAPLGAAFSTATKGIGRLMGPAAERMADVGTWLSPGSAGKTVLAGLGFSAAAQKVLPKINDAILKASEVAGQPGGQVYKDLLKSHYPKDLAQSAFYLGVGPEELNNLRSHLTPGAREAFDKHYNKMMNNSAAQKKVVQQEKAAANENKIDNTDDFHKWMDEQNAPKPPSKFGGNFGDEIYMHDFEAVPNTQYGSNPGGKYTHKKTGETYYIKEGKEDGYAFADARVRNELIASSLYNLAGTPTLQYHPVAGGKHIATKWEKLDKNNVYKFSPEERKAAQEDFVTHAWLGNYDAAGTGGDNLGILKGKPTILDNGGALEFRAQGKPKTDFGNQVTEIDSMRGLMPEKTQATDAKYVFGDMTDEELKKSAQKVISIPDEKIKATVAAHGGSEDLANKLIARKNDIAQRFGEVGGGEPPPNSFEYWTKKKQEADAELNKAVGEFEKTQQASFASKPLIAKKVDNTAQSKQDADGLLKKHGEDYEKIAKEIFDTAEEVGPKYADLVVGHLPSEMKADIGVALDKIAEKKGYDPWHMGKPPRMDEGYNSFGDFYHSQKIDGQFPQRWGDVPPVPKSGHDHWGNEVAEHSIESYQNLFRDGWAKNGQGTIMKPIDNFADWQWPLNTRPEKPHFTQVEEAKVKSLGFNTFMQFIKGTNKGKGYPELISDPAKKKSGYTNEHANFLFPDDGVHPYQSYGSKSDPYVLRADPGKAVEVYWPRIRGDGGYPSTGADYSSTIMQNFLKAARKEKVQILFLHGMSDMGLQNQTQVLVLDTRGTMRAPIAKFAPEHLSKESPKAASPIAGIAGGLVGYEALKDKDNGMKRGGKIKHPQIDENPQDHEFIDFKRGGLIDSDIPGRTDKIPMKVSPGAYVLPADIPSALGQGNTKAGHQILEKMFTHSANGLPPPDSKRHASSHSKLQSKAAGGEVDHVPIVAAGGEYIIHPDVVRHLGNGDMKNGHKLLDRFVIHTRKEHIKTLKSLKPPK